MIYKHLETEFFKAKSLQNLQEMQDIAATAAKCVSRVSSLCDLYEEMYGAACHPEDGIPETPLEKRYEHLRKEYSEAARLVRVCSAYV